MKQLIFAFLFFTLIPAFSQEWNGPVIKDFGPVYKVKDPNLLLKKGQKYKVIFDVHTAPGEENKPNPLITTVARFLNMHAKAGIKVKDLEVVLVLHGNATKASLSEKAYRDHFGKDNPDAALLKALSKNGVRVYVCGQSFTHRNYKRKELSRSVQMALSALTALVYYQSNGYSLITFN